MNPVNDLFVSSSKDGSVRLWDLAEKKLLAIYKHGRTATLHSKFAAFDNTAMVLAIAFSAAEVN